MVKSKLFWFIKSYFILNPDLFYLLIWQCLLYTFTVTIPIPTAVYRYQFDSIGF